MSPALPNFSPSAAETFLLCQRRWFFDKVVKLPREDDPTLAWGTAVHLVLENYLRDGVVLSPGTYTEGRDVVKVTDDHITRARAAFGHLPAPKTWNVELWVPHSFIGEMKVAAKIDLYNPSLNAIGDHKSTKTIRTSGPYAVTPTKLRTNAQGLFYAGALGRTGVLDATRDIEFFHNYVQREGPVLARKVQTAFTPEQVTEAWERSERTAAAMTHIAKNVSGDIASQDAVPYDTNACNAFGRPCPAMAVCRANTRRGLGSLVRDLDAARAADTSTPTHEDTMSLFDRFKKSPGTTPAAERPAPTQPTIQVTPPDAVGVDPETVQGAFLKDCARVLTDMATTMGMAPADLMYVEVAEALTAEHLPAVYHPNVAAAVGAGLPDAFEFLRSVDHAALLAGWPNTAESFRASAGGAVAATADALLTVPAKVAAEVADELPRAVVEAAITAAEAVGATEHAAALADVTGATLSPDALLDVAMKATTDPIHAKATVAAYEALRAGTAARVGIEDTVGYLRAAGRQRVRHDHKEEVLKALGHLPGVTVAHGMATYGRPATAPQVDPTPAPTATQVDPTPAPTAAQVDPTPTAPQVDPAPAPTTAPTVTAGRFVLVIGASVRGITTSEFADIPWVADVLKKVRARIEAVTGADYREWNDFGRTWIALVTAELDRAVTAGHELPGGWFWLDRYDALADVKTGLRAWVYANGGVVVG